jgi:NAD(P)-dependent dehydrogenase (short-subunit alcohol dehydrogenase family)
MNVPDGVVVVTGASDRMGRAIARAFAQTGASVVVHCHADIEHAQQTVHMIQAAKGNASLCVADLTTSDGVDNLVEHTLQSYGRWNILINAASVFHSVSLEDITIEQFHNDHLLHQMAPFFLSRALYLHRKSCKEERSGCVVNLSDTGVRNPVPSRPSYYSAKSSLEQQTIILGKALAPFVRINAVAPGAVLPASKEDAEYFSRLEQQLPMKKLATVDEVVKAVLFLCENDAITGQTIVVDGGEHLQ